MLPNDLTQLFEDISPKYYRQFRQLYNELLGYMEREEYDQIELFAGRLDQMFSRAYFANLALHKRIRSFQKEQRYLVQKSAMHHRFRNPQKTMPITHYFPLQSSAYPVDSPVVKGDQPSKTDNRDSVTQLVDQMTKFDQSQIKNNQMGATDEDVLIQEDTQSIESALPEQGTDFKGVIQDTPKEDHTPQSGVSVKDDLMDANVYFETPKTATDVHRSSPKRIIKSQKKEPPRPVSNRLEERKERIWEYIKNDQSSGGVSHDL